MDIELPFKAEYARSGRASCKGCKMNIAQGTLRIAAMVQSAFHDAKQPNWFHEPCFFKKQRPSSVGDIENFESLRFEDQKIIEKGIGASSQIVLPSDGKKSKKRGKEANGAVKDFGIEYAKSGRAACRGCELKILKDQIRIKKTVFDTEVGMKYGGQALWHHVECFAQLRSTLGWFVDAKELPGFKDLKPEDQTQVLQTIPAINPEEIVAKKAKLEPKDEVDAHEEKNRNDKVKKQMKRLYKFRDYIKDKLKKNEIRELLEYNDQDAVTNDTEKLWDQAADLLTFGALQCCDECGGSQFLFHKSGYLCNGNLTEWTKCTKLIKEPKRKACKVPEAMKLTYQFFKDVPKKPETREIIYHAPSASTITKNLEMKKGDEEEHQGPAIKRERPPLYNMQFAVIGLKDDEADIKTRIAKLGGTFNSKITEKTIAVFSNEKEVKRLGSRMEKAKELGIQAIPIDFISSVEADGAGALKYVNSLSLCDWGTDPATRVQKEELKSAKMKSIYTKSVPKTMTLKLKGGLAVDPDSGLEDVAHVYVKNKTKYNVVLGLTDVQRNKNSYYKIQLLESDSKNRYWVFRAWGRIGTTIGNNKLDSCSTLYDAIEQFKILYAEKTGNDFDLRENFVKVPGRMYPIDIDYTDNEKSDLNIEHKVKSKLEPAVQDLIKLLFDINNMKKAMLEFHLDMDKMPLGKLSQKQIQAAYKVLSEIYNLIGNSGSNAAFVDATNRFYTLIPHNFGVRSPPLLDTLEQIEKLREMLDSLMEIECAYKLMQNEKVDDDVNPIDQHYETLKAQLNTVAKESEEFATIKKYVENTHAETHNMYDLEIVDIFKVERGGEARRYKPFKKLHNRKLLWHGSRLTNFAGILSHGLKIAPAEAPVTGYMFGKGIYFADMVSKSANYCCTSENNSTGLVLLSEVALGDMFECTEANYVTKLPKDKHSCFGRGRTKPNPAESVMRPDGVEIPLGKPMKDTVKSSLLYNEYIVYDIAQVNIQYLLRLNFKYKS